jgi:hypothetical protein
MATTISMRDAKRLYNYGNHHGSGYSPYTDVAGDDTIEAAVAAAKAVGWTEVLARHNSDEIAVLVDGDGALLGIGAEANGHGAWAVALSDHVEALAKADADYAAESP